MKLLVFLFIHLLLFADQSSRTHSLCSSIDQNALLSFSIDVYPPLKWSSSVSCCSWEGIGCDTNDQVTRLWLPSRNIRGSIPPSLANLSFLSSLNLSRNFLTGHLPDEIFKSLNGIEIIDLSYNNLSGMIPKSLKNLHFLSSFSVAYNNLQGPLPRGGQFDTFSVSSFEGNPGLCGPLLGRSCVFNSTPPTIPSKPKKGIYIDDTNTIILAIFSGLGFGGSFALTITMLWLTKAGRWLMNKIADDLARKYFSYWNKSWFKSQAIVN